MFKIQEYLYSTNGASERTIPEHPSLLGFIKDLASTHDDYILGHQSIDAYLYVRFLKMIVVLCFVGCCITWPVLFPVNATGGGGQGGLDILSFSNVNSSGRYFVHTFVAWTYLGFVMFAITRETLHYISLRQAYLLSSWNASRISARTVLFTSIPDEYLDAQRLRHLFPAFKQIWIAMDPGDLNDKVEDRDEAALMLEKAEISMSEAANDKRLQVYNDNDKASEKDDEAPLSRPSNRRVDNDVRPTHRLKKKMVVEYGKKVDTIDWARDELAKSVPEIEELQDSHISNGSKRLPAAFVEFEDQQAAAVAFALSNHNEPAHIIGRQLGVLPDEVIWKNLHLKYWQTTIRYIIATAAVCALILFWSVPVAFVGILSNVDYLTGNVDFLRWLNSVPPVVLGVITGLLPTLLLALLMLLVPRLLRSTYISMQTLCAFNHEYPSAHKHPLLHSHSACAQFLFCIEQTSSTYPFPLCVICFTSEATLIYTPILGVHNCALLHRYTAAHVYSPCTRVLF